MTNPLRHKICNLIETSGPIDVATFMRLCLTDSNHGYYIKQTPFGTKGDFITAPEISQLFGELIGAWIADIWGKMRSPASFCLVEAGPGRGTLMADILRTLRRVANPCFNSAEIHLIEASDRLKKTQNDKLTSYQRPVHWHRDFESLPDQPILLVANEFLDALPIRQYQFSERQWAERVIGFDDQNELTWGLKPSNFKSPIPMGADDQVVFEVCPQAQQILSSLSSILNQQNGAALFIDYGYLTRGFGDTLQAVRAHEFADCLEKPGEADLTAHVDFAILSEIVRESGLNTHLTTQGNFLLNLGLLQRTGALGAAMDENGREKIRNDVERLAAPDQMGDLFKVMAITPKDITPHGFE